MSDAPELALDIEEKPAQYVTWTLASGGVAVVGFSIILYGWTAVETSGSAAATVNLYDGPATSSLIVVPVNLAQSESASDWYDRGIWLRNGLFISMGAGAAKGSVFYRHYRL